MLLYKPELVSGDKVPLALTHPKHLDAARGGGAQGRVITGMGRQIGAGAVLPDETFADVMLQALDQVSAAQQFSSDLAQTAITDPAAVDPHDLTIAQAKARMSLDITRTILNRVVQGWRDLINTR